MFESLQTETRCALGVAVIAGGTFWSIAAAGAEVPPEWRAEWPRTDFDKASVDFGEIMSGGPPKDGIPAIDSPRFIVVSEETDLAPEEPVIGLAIAGDARAYPLRILMWHEIVNDTVGGTPLVITYCPLCNAAIVFERELDGRTLSFGTTGKLRHSDLVMYDRQTESWWQQFLGRAIVGALDSRELRRVPARLESWQRFTSRHPEARVLIPSDPTARPYGQNPYVGYDSAERPFLYQGDLPDGLQPMSYVVVVDDEAWTLELVRRRGSVRSGDIEIRWQAGNRSALDTRHIPEGRDVGNVVVQRDGAAGSQDVPYDLTFAFVFHAFHPETSIHR